MRRHLVFSVVSVAVLLSAISVYSASVALPIIISDLDTTLILAGWVLTSYALVQTVTLALAGKINEMLGSRATFIVYTVLFSAGSMLCALAPNVYLLIGARVVQAVGGGGFMPAAAEITSEQFPEMRQRYIGLLSAIGPIGIVIGPNIGGWLAESFGWRSTFWFNIPLGIAILVLGLLLLPVGGKKEKTSVSIDFTGAGLLFGFLFAIMFGMTELGSGTSGIPWISSGVLFALGIGLGVAFWRRESRSPEPIIDFELLRRGPFLAANIFNLVYSIGALGMRALVPLYAVSVYNMSILQSGIALTPWSLGMILTSAVTSFHLMEWGYRKPMLLGVLVLTIGFILLALEPRGVEVMGFRLGVTPLLLAIMALCGLGHGICTPASSNACVELMPDKVATLFGIRGMFRNLGSAIGTAAATVLIHNIGDAQRAFQIVLLAMALTTLITLPAIFAMPVSPRVTASQKQTARLQRL